jgi:hypothetical protein
MTRSRDTSNIARNAKKKGKETFYVGAKQWRQPSVNGATASEQISGDVALDNILFINGATRTSFLTYALPKSYDGGMLSYKLFYYGAGTASGQLLKVMWKMESANLRSDSDTQDSNDGSVTIQDHTAQSSGTTGSISHLMTNLFSSGGVYANKLNTTPFVDFKPHRTWGEGVTLSSFKLSRLGLGADDTYSATVCLVGVQFQYTTDLPNDD